MFEIESIFKDLLYHWPAAIDGTSEYVILCYFLRAWSVVIPFLHMPTTARTNGTDTVGHAPLQLTMIVEPDECGMELCLSPLIMLIGPAF